MSMTVAESGAANVILLEHIALLKTVIYQYRQ
jgi:hypothetical protein